ncbi:TonB-dependent receptor [Pedobacter sp. PLR]|uniref:SusC/RagA family TonB-linked outer membrane protein n=1 Tax=Pedobacter sp. PLR TaxID=2994465 RepID=UPI002245E3AD|nr:TonB-dependent receptor [Pedobacter sp. PLR]MCX2450343.1 TonB-dependent receptor [Pedobacter sp. PLR]
MKRNLLLICFLLFGASGFAQNITVKGEVTDAETKGPIPSVNVSVKGTKNRAGTNGNGIYTLSNVDPKAILVFSYIGYKTEERSLNGKTQLNVTLTPDFGNLDEVVVVGFGSKKKINIAGAIDQISGKELESRPVANVMQGLQGLSPGLSISYAGGAPGSVPKINIRGYTSVNGGSPLVVIDGIPATSNDDMLRLNPSDISSFTVLRDAASSAIYGARAAFGVILITTKQGEAGKQIITYNTFVSRGKPTVLARPVTDPYIFSRVLETATDNTPWDYVNFSDEYYKWAKERSDNPSLPDTRLDPADKAKWAYMGNNDWYSYFFNDASVSQSHAVSLSGGAKINEKPLTYYLSADYAKDNGLNKLAPDYWSRYGLRSRVGFSPLSWLRLDNNLNIYQTKREEPFTDIRDLYYLKPTDVAKNPDGTWANTGAGRLAARLVDGGGNIGNMFGFQNVTSAVATFFNGELQVNGDASFKRELWRYHKDSKKFKIGYGPGDIREEGGNGSVRESNNYLANSAFNLYTTYKKTIGDHAFGAMVGYNSEIYDYSTVNAERDLLMSSSLPYLGLTTGQAIIGADYSAYATNSVFSRVNYTYKDRYILEGTGRYDGSSRFPVASRWGFFPSASFAWIASSEEFLKPLAPVLSVLKLRATYGNLGNQNVGNFDYIQTLPTENSRYLIDGSLRPVIKEAPKLYIDPNTYTWERVSTLNLGTDVGLMNDKFMITFDYYIRDTKGMLVAGQELPGVIGTGAPKQNVADLRTKGWELSLTYRDHFDVAAKPFNFSTKVFLSDSRSKITSFTNTQNLFTDYRVGQTIGEIWGLESDGFFKDKAEIAALDQKEIVPWGALDIVPGWPKYKDLNGDHKIERGLSSDNPKDLKVIGNTTDRYSVGANINMDWNGFDLSIFMQGVLKRDFYPHHYLFWGPYQQPYANVYPWNLDFYRGVADSPEQRAKHSAAYIAAGLADANLDSQYPVMQAWLADANAGGGLDIPQTKYLLNGAYLRIKNVTLGYTLPKTLTKRYGINRLRVYVSGENMYEFSAIKKFIDPESINQSTSAWAYPFQRRYAVGLNLDF